MLHSSQQIWGSILQIPPHMFIMRLQDVPNPKSTHDPVWIVVVVPRPEQVVSGRALQSVVSVVFLGEELDALSVLLGEGEVEIVTWIVI